MQELRAQIQAQLKLADTLRKLGEDAGENDSLMLTKIFKIVFNWNYFNYISLFLQTKMVLS